MVTQHTTLERKQWPVPDVLGSGPDAIVPFRSGEIVEWRLVGNAAMPT